MNELQTPKRPNISFKKFWLRDFQIRWTEVVAEKEGWMAVHPCVGKIVVINLYKQRKS